LLAIGELKNGQREVFFELNRPLRSLFVRDKAVSNDLAVQLKAVKPGD
jgi:pyruvate carboxylase